MNGLGLMIKALTTQQVMKLGALPSFSGLYTWLKGEAQYLIYIAIVVFAVVLCYNKKFTQALVSVLGLGFLSYAAMNPEIIVGWFTAIVEKLGGA